MCTSERERFVYEYIMRTTNTVMAVACIRGLLCMCALMLATCYPDVGDNHKEHNSQNKDPNNQNKNHKTFRLKLLHTNDMHSFFEEFNYTGMPCQIGEKCYGGFPRLKKAIDNELDKIKTDPDVGLLVLNAGDTFQGTMFYSVFKWRIVADLLPKLGIDAMCLGNHEFDDGVQDIDLFLEHIKIPVVVSNIDLSNEPSLARRKIMTKSTILEVKGHKIGIIGYLTPDTATLSTVGNVKFKDEIPSIREEAIRLKNAGIKIIIALGHSGFQMDQMIAQEVEEVDVVVGGHTHTFLYDGKPPISYDKPAGAYPFCVTQPITKKQVPVVQAYQATKYLGSLNVEFNNDGEVLSSYGNPILLDFSIKQDPELLKIVVRYQQEFHEKTKQIIGQTLVKLEGYGHICRLKECNFGDFITDAYVKYNSRNNTEDFDSNEFWTDAPIAVQHSGGIRADIDSSSDKNGNITYIQLMNAIQFTNTMGKVYLTGAKILEMLEKAVYRYDGKTRRGEFLQMSGLKILIDLSKPSGHRIASVLVKSKLKGSKDYDPINIEETYRVIMSEYIWNGGDGFEFDTKSQKFINIRETNFTIIEQEIRKNSPISPGVDGRLSFINKDHLNENNPVLSPSQESIIYHATFCGNKPEN